jgi:hypothetical protein
MKSTNLIKILVAMLLAAGITMAQTVAALQTAITNHGLSAAVSGNIVTVTGTREGATDELRLNIPGGVTVRWQASLSGATTGASSLVYLNSGVLNSGVGTLEVTSGKIEQTGSGNAISNYASGTINVSGGTVSATTGRAIYTVFSFISVIELNNSWIDAACSVEPCASVCAPSATCFEPSDT